ncbi:MAG: hypothetical protein QOJ89_2746 [bacterium]|jgi:hypothetical protein
MTGLMQRIFRRRASGSPRRGAAGLFARLPAGLRRRRSGQKSLPWGKQGAAQQPVALIGGGAPTAEVVETTGTASFRDRGRLRRRLRYLRRARELAFRDVGGLIFDMRRFERDRPDLVEAKLGALAAVDRELRALERVLDDPRPIHELREPGLSSCPRCGALHASEDNFCPHCGLQIGGPQAMGEVGGAIAAPPQAPPAPIEQSTAPTLIAPGVAAAAAGAAAAPAPTTAAADGAPPVDAGPIASPADFAPTASPAEHAPTASPSEAAPDIAPPSADGNGDGSAAAAPEQPDEPQPTEILRPPDAP